MGAMEEVKCIEDGEFSWVSSPMSTNQILEKLKPVEPAPLIKPFGEPSDR